AAGELRSEFVYLFGALLEEWARESPAESRQDGEGREAQRRLLAEALTAPPAGRRPEFLAALLDGMKPSLDKLSKRRGYWCGRDFRRAPRGKVCTAARKNSGDNFYTPPRLRAEARRFASSGPLPSELSDAARPRFPRAPAAPPAGGLL